MKKFYSYSKTYCSCDVTSNEFNFNSKNRNKRVPEQSADGRPEKCLNFVDGSAKLKSPIRRIRTKDHTTATCEQVFSSQKDCRE